MSLTASSIAAIVIYTSWVSILIRGDYRKDKYLISKTLPKIFAVEIVCNAIMTYLLLVRSAFFLYFNLVAAMTYACAGMYTEIFRPDVTSSRVDMKKYWTYVTLDIAISLTCYLLSGA